jgi:DNA (cytosine-5)-methyltransferase 1
LDSENQDQKFQVQISHIKGIPFFEEVRKVSLISCDWNLKNLLILWKAFEKEIIENQIRADLVQLNGYYQYNPIFKIEFLMSGKEIPIKHKATWMFLVSLVEDLDNGKIRALNELANLYDIDSSSIVSALKDLKSIGFEIRNHNTNPEIPENHYLIPYKFPSLNNLSLQLKTSL